MVFLHRALQERASPENAREELRAIQSSCGVTVTIEWSNREVIFKKAS